MELFNELIKKKRKIAVVGLGYVGMPLAVAFSKKLNVIGFDLNREKIELYKQGIDPTNEVGDKAIKECNVHFTYNEDDLDDASVFIIAVPTPINLDKTPDLSPIKLVSEIIGKHISKNSIVIYESTVYPGVTENICLPILENFSNLEVIKDFKIGYSPERINPGDKVHRLENIVKVVSGIDEESLEIISSLYELIIDAGVHRASTIKVAEAAKVVENSQRDINIAFMNELAMVFDKMDINTNEVIEAMNTKWNALGFYPGLVGGHCIGVDPYYFIYEAERLGYHSQIVLSGRKINDKISKFISEAIIKKLLDADKIVSQSKVVILGLTFKENTPDIRNTKIIDIVENLKKFRINPIVVDPVADKEEAKKHYNIDIVDIKDVKEADCIVFAVSHKEFLNIDNETLSKLYKPDTTKIVIDVRSTQNKKELLANGYSYWSL